MKIQVDADICQGHGRCFSFAPELFDSDDMGHAIADNREVPPELEEAAEKARLNCPEYAITVD